ncbi:MAG: hypothetical protein HKN36_04740 [Hellea sp.]|nr:hypothetical protein [Hellea sp.]
MSKSSDLIEMPRKRVLAIAGAIAGGVLLLLLAAMFGAEPQPVKQHIPMSADDPALVIIDDSAITQSQLDLAREYLETTRPEDAPTLSETDILDYLVQQRLLSDAAAKRDLNKNRDILNRVNLTHERLLSEALIKKQVEATISDQEIMDYYDAQKKLSGNRIQVKARQIVVPDEATAKEIVRRLEAGETFDSLAIAYSIDRASREAAGELGYINRDMLNPEFSRRVFAGKVGARLAPFASDEGWHIVEVQGRRTAPFPNIESQYDEIRTLLTAKRMDQLLQELRQDADIEYLDASSKLTDEPTQ